jgi:hypothetical protein
MFRLPTTTFWVVDAASVPVFTTVLNTVVEAPVRVTVTVTGFTLKSMGVCWVLFRRVTVTGSLAV